MADRKREVFTTIFGLTDGYSDPFRRNDAQLNKAVEAIPQANRRSTRMRARLSPSGKPPSVATRSEQFGTETCSRAFACGGLVPFSALSGFLGDCSVHP